MGKLPNSVGIKRVNTTEKSANIVLDRRNAINLARLILDRLQRTIDEDVGVHLVVFSQRSRPYISIKIPKESEWYAND
ncbi:MAG: hypothetical protein ACTSSD_19475 [Candidatus Thorarchaeota archaeon]